jgi:hypothetical protein
MLPSRHSEGPRDHVWSDDTSVEEHRLETRTLIWIKCGRAQPWQTASDAIAPVRCTYMAQALRSRIVTATETTIDPTIPSPFEKKKNMGTSALDNGGRRAMFLDQSRRALPRLAGRVPNA